MFHKTSILKRFVWRLFTKLAFCRPKLDKSKRCQCMIDFVVIIIIIIIIIIEWKTFRVNLYSLYYIFYVILFYIYSFFCLTFLYNSPPFTSSSFLLLFLYSYLRKTYINYPHFPSLNTGYTNNNYNHIF